MFLFIPLSVSGAELELAINYVVSLGPFGSIPRSGSRCVSDCTHTLILTNFPVCPGLRTLSRKRKFSEISWADTDRLLILASSISNHKEAHR